MSNYVKFNRGLSKSQFKLYVKNSNTVILSYPSLDTMIFFEPHISGNVDVYLNGLLLTPEITSTRDVSGTNNLSSSLYEYRSGIYDSSTGIFTAQTLAQRGCTHIEIQSIASNDSIIQIRSYWWELKFVFFLQLYLI